MGAPMTSMTPKKMQTIIEAALMIDGPLTITSLQNLFPEEERPSSADIKSCIELIKERHADAGIELHEVASGFRFQAKAELSPWLSKLWEERAPRYSRAFLETLSIIAYKQPITRAEIEEIRGVTVSSNIVKTLMEREWVRILGHKEVPGKPAIFGTTKEFLDHFNLKSLTELPSLAEFKDLEAQEAQLQVQLAIENSGIGPDNSEVIPEEREALIVEEDTAEEHEASTSEENASEEQEALTAEDDITEEQEVLTTEEDTSEEQEVLTNEEDTSETLTEENNVVPITNAHTNNNDDEEPPITQVDNV